MKQQNKNIKFDITQILKQVENRRKHLMLLFIILPIYGVIFSPHKSDIHLTLYLVVFIIILLVNILYYSLRKRYILDGTLLLNTEFIQIKNDVVLLENIEQVYLKYEGFKGSDFPLAVVGIGTFGVKDGANNLLEVRTKTGVVKKITFLSKTNKDRQLLNKYLSYYRKKGITITK
jgi:hypothetical protein